MRRVMQSRRQRVTEAQLEIKPGQKVQYRNDLGEIEHTTAHCGPWQLGHGDWVISLEGKSGGYDLSRVTPEQ